MTRSGGGIEELLGTTDKVFDNLKSSFDEAKELDGYDELP